MAHRTEVSFGGQFYDNIATDVGNLPKAYRAEFLRRSRNPIRNLSRRLRREPSKQPAHPFIWSFEQEAQERARRWWFAAIAGRIPGVRIETSGGRYKRSGKGVKSIKVIFNRPEGTIVVEYGDGLEFVMGKKQVPSHQRTGWKLIDKELQKAEVEFLDNSIAVWDDVTSKVGDR